MIREAHEGRQKEEVELARTGTTVAAATKLNAQLEDLDRRLRKARLTIPPESAYEEVETAFWAFVEALQQAEFNGVNTEEIAALPRDRRALVVPGAGLQPRFSTNPTVTRVTS